MHRFLASIARLLVVSFSIVSYSNSCFFRIAPSYEHHVTYSLPFASLNFLCEVVPRHILERVYVAAVAVGG